MSGDSIQPSNPSAPKDEKDYEAENAADTLVRAAEIQGNPDLHSRAMKHLNKKKTAINSIKSLKAKRNDLLTKGDTSD